jgi:adenylate kinase
MSKLVLLMGSSETGHETISKLSTQFSQLRFDRISLNALLKTDNKTIKDIDAAMTVRQNVFEIAEKRVIESYKKGRNVMIHGSFVVETPFGFMPVITHDFFRVFTPNALIVLEVHIDKKIPRTHEAIERLKVLEQEQELNRYYAQLYSSLSGSLLKIITIKPHNVKYALKDVRNVISFILGE